MTKKKLTKNELRQIADKWIEFSLPAMAGAENTIEAVFLGAMLFAHGKPMSLHELAKSPLVRNRTSAKRWAERLCYLGVAKRTDEGLVTTKLGEETGEFYFSKMYSLLDWVDT